MQPALPSPTQTSEREEILHTQRRTNLFDFAIMATAILGVRALCICFDTPSPLHPPLLIFALLLLLTAIWSMAIYSTRPLTRAGVQGRSIWKWREETWARFVVSVECLLILGVLQVLNVAEEDEAIRVLEHTTISVIMLRFVFSYLNSLQQTIVAAVIQLAFFGWTCARHTQNPLFALWMMAGTMFVRLHSMSNDVKRDRENSATNLKLDEEKCRYEVFIQVLHDPVLIIQPAAFVLANSACINKLGINETNYKRRLLMFKAGGKETLLGRITSAFENNSPLNASEDDYKYGMGELSEKSTYHIHIFNFGEKETTKALAVVFRDLTEERETEKRKAKERYSNLMFHSVSHELRTPLNGIHGILTFMKKMKFLSTAVKQKVAQAKAMCLDLGNEIANILDYTQISLNEFALHPEKTNIIRMITKLIKLTGLLLADKNAVITLNMDALDMTTHNLFLDAAKLEQVLASVLSYAVTRIESGSIDLAVRVLDERELEFKLVDTGRIITPHELEDLFGKESCFIQGQKEMTSLRLRVAYMVCNKMGGEMQIQSEEGKNTMTIIRVPYSCPHSPARERQNSKPNDWSQDVEEMKSPITFNTPTMDLFRRRGVRKHHVPTQSAELVRPSSQERHRNHASQPGTFLIVDDVELNRFVLRNMLNKHHWDIREAANGQDAVSMAIKLCKASRGRKVVIFMDIDMPIMNGIDAALKIRELCIVHRPYIVATTAFTSERERATCIEVGMDSFIAKPVTSRHLHDLMILILNKEL